MVTFETNKHGGDLKYIPVYIGHPYREVTYREVT